MEADVKLIFPKVFIVIFGSWPLVVASKYNIPYLLDSKGGGKRVLGQIFEVDPGA